MANQDEIPKDSKARRIVVIDDNRDAADTLAIMLRLKGNEVKAAYDGYQGFQLAENFLADVVVLDIGMPGLDGYQTCKLIRGSPLGETMLIIALTGYGQPEDVRKSSDAGFDAHLLKPVDIAELLDFIESA